MTPKEILRAMRLSGVLQRYMGQKKVAHEDGALKDAGIVYAPDKCAAWTVDRMGTNILDPSMCNCGVGEWLVEPKKWATELVALLEGEA